MACSIDSSIPREMVSGGEAAGQRACKVRGSRQHRFPLFRDPRDSAIEGFSEVISNDWSLSRLRGRDMTD
ncbi:hypothetical protein Dimus_023507 [Dionaea muscipula]